MSQVTLQGPFVSASPTTAAPHGVPGVIADPPPAVTQLASGHLLQGEVVGRNDQGQTLVRTELGTLAVTTKAQLPTGSQVTLQIRTAGAQIQIAVLQVDGHAPHLRGSGPAVAAAAAPPSGPAATGPPPAVSPPAGQPTPQAGRPAAGLPGTIANPPASIANLPTGSLLQGAVLGRDAAGHYLVRTEFGTLPLTTDVQLASGNRVSLQVTSVVPQVQVLVSPAEAAPQGALSGAARLGAGSGGLGAGAGQAGQGAASPHIATTVDILTVGQAVRAVVAGPPATPAQAPQPATLPGGTGPLAAGLPGATAEAASGPLSLPVGAAVQLRIIQVTPPGTAGFGPAGAGLAGSGVAGVGPAGLVLSGAAPAGVAPTGGGQAAAGSPPLPAGSPAQAAPPPAAGSIRLEGLVTGNTPPGQPQVQTLAGLLTLQIGSQLPAGTRLALDLPQQQLAALTAQTLPQGLPEAAGGPLSLAYAWPALQLALDGLETLDAAEARALLSPQGPATPLPQPGARLSSAMLFFINALAGGNPGAWLGDLLGGQAGKRLERAGQSELLNRLRGDLGGMSRLAEAGGDNWRLLPIPLYNNGQVQQMRMFLRRRRDGSKQRGKDGEATRFVLEVSLTRLGDLQLDGLVRPKRFDLILRSRQSLPLAMRQDISAIFESANGATGFEGSITFQDSPDWQPMPISATASGMVV
jgi:hypothetical protein